jgi:hypothetical protein
MLIIYNFDWNFHLLWAKKSKVQGWRHLEHSMENYKLVKESGVWGFSIGITVAK